MNYLVELAEQGSGRDSVVPARTKDGRLFPPRDLPAGTYALCAGCAYVPVNEACEGCPRISVGLYRQLAARRRWWQRRRR